MKHYLYNVKEDRFIAFCGDSWPRNDVDHFYTIVVEKVDCKQCIKKLNEAAKKLREYHG